MRINEPEQNGIWAQLKERKVIRVLIGYAVLCFVVLQVIDAVGESIGLTNEMLRLGLLCMVAAVPVIGFFAWAIDLHADGSIFESPATFTSGLVAALGVSILIGLGGWQLINGLAEPASAPSYSNYAKDQTNRRIALLPFRNISNEPKQAYFVDGMTEALIAELAQIEGLRVVSRSTVMQLKESPLSISEIALKLDVNVILEGAIQIINNEVSIYATLVDTINEDTLWARNYSEPLTNVLRLQARVAADVAREIGVTLSGADEQRANDRISVDVAAHNAYLRGRHFWNQRQKEGFDKALQLFNDAIRIQPDYAAAHAAIADLHALIAIYEYEVPSIALDQAEIAARRAIELDPNNGHPYSVLGMVHAYRDHDWQLAAQAYERGIELSPSDPQTHQYAAVHLMMMGRLTDSEHALAVAQSLDPLSPLGSAFKTQLHSYRRQPDSAIGVARRALEIHPDFPATLWRLGLVYMQSGHFEDAKSTFKRLVNLSDRNPIFLSSLAQSYGRLGQATEARALLEEIRERTLDPALEHGRLAPVYLSLGDKDAAVAALKESIGTGQFQLLELYRGPTWDELRDHSGFQDLLRQLAFPSG